MSENIPGTPMESSELGSAYFIDSSQTSILHDNANDENRRFSERTKSPQSESLRNRNDAEDAENGSERRRISKQNIEVCNIFLNIFK